MPTLGRLTGIGSYPPVTNIGRGRTPGSRASHAKVGNPYDRVSESIAWQQFICPLVHVHHMAGTPAIKNAELADCSSFMELPAPQKRNIKVGATDVVLLLQRSVPTPHPGATAKGSHWRILFSTDSNAIARWYAKAMTPLPFGGIAQNFMSKSNKVARRHKIGDVNGPVMAVASAWVRYLGSPNSVKDSCSVAGAVKAGGWLKVHPTG